MNKTFFTHFDCNYVRIDCFFCHSKQEVVEFSTRMRDFISKNSVNKVCTSISNCHIGNKFQIKVSGLYSTLFVIIFPLIFQKTWRWGKQKGVLPGYRDLYYFPRIFALPLGGSRDKEEVFSLTC